MRQILPHHLWLGHAGDASDFRRQFDLGIEAILQVAMEEPPVQPPRELIYCRFPLLDGTGNRAELLHVAIETTAAFLRMRLPILICCSAGLSRSPVLAAAALARAFDQSPEECLRAVFEQHPSDVSGALWNDVRNVLSAL
jgi:protein-tyrosine phosphatase